MAYIGKPNDAEMDKQTDFVEQFITAVTDVAPEDRAIAIQALVTAGIFLWGVGDVTREQATFVCKALIEAYIKERSN